MSKTAEVTPLFRNAERALPDLIKDLLLHLGEDPYREGLAKTPQRVSKSLRELTSGYHVDIDRLINGALFDVPYNEMVVVKDVDFYSLCEHHLLPFFGKCHVAYVPDGKVIGRGVVHYSSRDIARIAGKRTAEVRSILGAKSRDEVIHRNDLVIWSER